MTPLEQKAKEFATQKHGEINQVRKYTGEPYINHPEAVANLVRNVPHTPKMLAAAWLHDVVEDTDTTIEEIKEYFGGHVAHLVSDLTDISQKSDGKRKLRKQIDRIHLRSAQKEAKTIKLADLIDNSKSILERDPKFAKVYIQEKELLLEVLKEGDETLWSIAFGIVKNAKFQLGL